MASAKRSGFGDWDKGETGFHDVGLGLRLQQQRQSDVFSRSGEGYTRMTFTANQRQELERQTVIYKYMMASMPVPPELLIPLTKYPPITLPQLLLTDHQSCNKKAYNGRGGGGGAGGDPEPWRCRRTDGKKWRCSRDVAPDQKYCERHSHKGRPSARSRKPVESSLHHHNHNHNHHVSHHPTPSTTFPSTTTATATNNCNPIVLNPFQQQKHPSSPFDLLPSSLAQYTQTPRYPEWFMKEEILPAAHSLYPQLEQLVGETRGNTSQFNHRGISDQTTCLLPRPFIDAWSLEDVHKVSSPNPNPTSATNNVNNLALPTEFTGNSNKCPTSCSMNSILPLTLSMSAGLDDPDNSRSGQKDDDDHGIREVRTSQQQPSNWMSSWINLPPGGPLAEALCLGMSGTANAWATHSDDLVSPHGRSSGSSCTTMSSKGSRASADTNGQGFQLH